MVMAVSLVFAACDKEPDPVEPDPNDPNHQHTYSEEWTIDENYHWRNANCGHDVYTDYGPHDVQADGYCRVCKQQILVLEGSFEIFNDQSHISDAKVLGDPVPQTQRSVAVHYRRLNSAEYKTWGFWIWTAGQEGRSYTMKAQDSFGGIAYFPLQAGQDNARFGLIPLFCNGTETDTWDNATWKKDDAGADRFFEPDDFTFNEETNCYDVYLLAGDIALYHSVEESNYIELNYGIKASFTSRTKIDILFASAVKKVSVLEDSKTIDETEITTQSVHVAYTLPSEADINKSYTIAATFTLKDRVATGGVDITVFYDLAEFADTFYYEGDDLGATLGPKSTTFKVWSPVSTRMVLNLYNEGNGGEAYETHNMTKTPQGVWEYTVPERIPGRYYTYTVYNGKNPKGMEIVDPYAKSAGVDGKRGMIVNFASDLVTPEGWNEVEPIGYDANELVVWETHVADVTSSDTWGGNPDIAKTFLGMIQKETTYTKGSTTVKTGFDHIKELGVNAVQLVPVFDQSNLEEVEYRSFNWGYNPLNYNVLEGAYSTDPYDGYTRILEFRQLVQAFHDAGINIIMDVVYNHVNEASNSNFEVLMPGYYFRHSTDGSLSSDSGCGNDTMSERPMFRKFMIDSVCFWADTYKLGGFRFDIMGLHDLETMKQLTARLRQINPDMIFYGEAWGNNTTSVRQMADQGSANSFPDGLGQFNDRMRDQVFNYVVGESYTDKRITDGFKGGTTEVTNDLYKTVNYVTCHDGYTLYNNIQRVKFYLAPDAEKQAMLAQSMILTSNGISFILAGEEMLRSKEDLGGLGEQIHNSYNAPYAVNALDYERKADHLAMFENYQKLIAFKKMFVDTFGLDSNANVTAKYTVDSSNGSYFINIVNNGTRWIVAHSASGGATVEHLSGATLYWSTTGRKTLDGDTVTLQPYETLIVSKTEA